MAVLFWKLALAAVQLLEMNLLFPQLQISTSSVAASTPSAAPAQRAHCSTLACKQRRAAEGETAPARWPRARVRVCGSVPVPAAPQDCTPKSLDGLVEVPLWARCSKPTGINAWGRGGGEALPGQSMGCVVRSAARNRGPLAQRPLLEASVPQVVVLLKRAGK